MTEGEIRDIRHLARWEEKRRKERFQHRGHRGDTEGAEKRLGQSARVEEEMGDLLFAAVNVARFLEIDPEILACLLPSTFK